MTAVFTTLTLPPAFLGEPYEAAFGVTVGSQVAVTSAVGTTDTGLPPGIVINADGTRLTGTPTGALSTPGGTGTATQGTGTYTFTVTPQNGSGTAKQFSLSVWGSPTDPYYMASLPLATQAAVRQGTDQS